MNNSAFNLAKVDASRIHGKYPYLLSNAVGINELILLSKLFSISVIEIQDLLIEGRLEIRPEGAAILVNTNLKTANKAFVIAHEIGHYVLRYRHPEIQEKSTLKWREDYANQFAYELCLPQIKKEDNINLLNTTDSISTLLKLCQKHGMSIRYFLKKMHFEQFQFCYINQSEYQNLWLVAKWVENAFTHSEPKLRVVASYFDSNKYFIAENQGLDRILVNMEWLNNLSIATEENFKGTILITKRNRNAKPEYNKEYVEAYCSALKLQESKKDLNSKIILLLRVKT